MSGIKNTPMRDFHVEMGAKMVPVSGWNLPFSFPCGAAAEHKHTLSACSIFDSTPAGKFQISGENAGLMLDSIFFRSAADLEVGGCRSNLILSEEGGVLESLTVCRMREQDFFLVGNAANVLKLSALFQKKRISFRNLTEDLAKIDIRGPKTLEILGQSGVNLSALPEKDHVSVVEIDGLNAIVMRTDLFGTEGFEFMMTADCADQIWDLFLDSGIVEPAGLAAQESLRIEAGLPAYGAELRLDWSPFDSGWEPDLSSGRDFTGKTALSMRPRQRRLAGAVIEGKRAPRVGTEIMNENDKVIGMVTSGAFSPTLNCGIALCSLEYGVREESLLFRMTGENMTGKVCPLPFTDLKR